MSDMAVFTSVAIVGSVAIVASGLTAFVATCHDGPSIVPSVSGSSRADSKEVRASGVRGVSWWQMRRSKPLNGDSSKSAPIGCNSASHKDPPTTRGRSEHAVGARERSKAPSVEKREARSVSREPPSVRSFQQHVQAERIEVKPVCREQTFIRTSSCSSTTSAPSGPSPEPFRRASATSTASTPSPNAMRKASHLTSATAVPLTPAATMVPPQRLGDTLTNQQQFLQAASKLSDEELRDFVADLISAEMAAINKLSPELRAPAYRSLCIAWHPDKCPAIASIATSVFQHLQAQKNKIL